MPDSRIYVVAGNGESLETIKPGQVLSDDFIVRTNNFFFEGKFWLGRRVDLAVMGGDPRVAPFMFQTLKDSLPDYELRNWLGIKQNIENIGKARLKTLPLQMTPYVDEECQAFCDTLLKDYQCQFMTGTIAILHAVAHGAKNIVICGMDLYEQNKRYSYEPGKMQRALLGSDLGERGVDTRLHNSEMDVKLFAYLAARPDLYICYAGKNPILEGVLPEAEIREGAQIQVEERKPPEDWAHFAGAYPIWLLLALRRIKSLQRRLFGRF